MKIGFIDSGIGGLSVLKAFIAYPIMAEYFYIADTAHLPYGLKTHGYIHHRMQAMTEYLLNIHHIDMLVIACNTATAISAQQLRHEYPNLIIIGIEPAIKPAALASKTKEIAILATTSMIHNDRLSRLIHDFAHEVNVTKIPADSWVAIVEQGIYSGDRVKQAIYDALTPIENLPIDQLILGCTHFPFLEHELRSILKPEIQLINPASAVAKYADRRQQERFITHDSTCVYHYFTTGNLPTFQNHLNTLKLPQDTVSSLAV